MLQPSVHNLVLNPEELRSEDIQEEYRHAEHSKLELN